ncbi:MAG: hypothetical protein ACR2QJ_10385, partial [Geminicoccaceae bacterium]
YLQQNRFLQRSLIEGSEAGAARGRLIFEEDFVAKVVQFGVTQGLIAETTVADVRAAAATLFERADDAKFDDQRFARALAQQLALDDVALNRVIAGITYARRAETRADQHRRLAEVILAFKVKAEAGIGAMTPATWIQALADYSETLADLVGRRVEEPTRSGMANLLDHLGVPGYRMIDLSSKTILHLTNDRSGRVADLRVEKRRKGLGHLVFFDEGQKLVRP